MSVLPDKLSALIRVAVEDCKKIETMSNYKLNMDLWHTPTNNDICEVCMAGAVMAVRLQLSINRHAWPHEFSSEAGKLRAIDSVRIGDVVRALKDLSVESYNVTTDINSIEKLIKDNCDKDRASWEIYFQAADMLEELGY